MSPIITAAAARPHAVAPNMATFMSMAPGLYHQAEESTPTTKAAPTAIRMAGA